MAGTPQQQSPAEKAARAVGFTGDALAIILSISICDQTNAANANKSVPTWDKAKFAAAWLQSKGGKDFSSFPCYSGGDYAKNLNTVARQMQGDITLSPDLQKTSDQATWQNGIIANAIPGFDIQRIVTGIFGGILVIIGLMMFVKQLTGVSITGVPGKVGKVLALA